MYVVELQATNVLRKPFVILEQQYIYSTIFCITFCGLWAAYSYKPETMMDTIVCWPQIVYYTNKVTARVNYGDDSIYHHQI